MSIATEIQQMKVTEIQQSKVIQRPHSGHMQLKGLNRESSKEEIEEKKNCGFSRTTLGTKGLTFQQYHHRLKFMHVCTNFCYTSHYIF